MGSGDYMQRAQQLKTQQDLTNSAADTTASLQRTRQLMAEVSPSLPSRMAYKKSCSGQCCTLSCFQASSEANISKHSRIALPCPRRLFATTEGLWL